MKIDKAGILQIGIGGTGSWLCPPLFKFLNNLSNSNIKLKYIGIDNDFVESRNILRQNFINIDIGRTKVSSMIRRCNHMFKNSRFFNIRIKSYKDLHTIFRQELSTFNIIIVIGCVDNNITRRRIYQYLKKFEDRQIIYIDSGNNLYNGQIITSMFNIDNYKNIDFTSIFKLKGKNKKDQTCAFFGDQTQGINMLAANIVFLIIQNLFMESDYKPPTRIDFNITGNTIIGGRYNERFNGRYNT